MYIPKYGTQLVYEVVNRRACATALVTAPPLWRALDAELAMRGREGSVASISVSTIVCSAPTDQRAIQVSHLCTKTERRWGLF